MERKYIKWIIIGIVVLLAIITLFNSFKSVPTGYVGVKTQFGKVQDDVLQEGLNVVEVNILHFIQLCSSHL